MLIDSKVYHQFYQVLWDDFIKKEWTSQDMPRAHSQALWRLQTPFKKFVVMDKILWDTGFRDERYFYRKYLELNPAQRRNGKVDTLAICRALEYMGFKVADNIRDRESLQVRTESLLKQFIETSCPNVEHGHKLYEMGDDVRTDVTESESEKIEKNEVVLNSPVHEQEDDVKFTIMSFYERIGSGDFEEAWKLMSPDFQNRLPWQGDVSKFGIGYVNTVGIRDILVFKIEKRFPNLIEAQVYYEDEISAYTSPVLISIPAMQVADLDDFVTNVRNLQRKLDEQGGKGFEKIELYKLFEPAASEYIWYRCGIKTDEISNLFPARKTVFVKRLYCCSCKLIDGLWFINGLKGVPIQSAR